MKELKLDGNNPCPFVQPFLELHFKDDGGKSWHIDVNGQIDDYLKDYKRVYEALGQMTEKDPRTSLACVHFNWMSQATPLLQSVVQQLTETGWHIDCACGYVGLAGPSHILRNGAFFERVSIKRQEESPVVTKKESNDIADFLPQIFGEAVHQS
jgi:hypothetical protein